jgi:uncharacterized protein YyaL (SSP411 family)
MGGLLILAIHAGATEDLPAGKHAHSHTNRLIHETSPYLLQHAHNPVDWYPWGEEAFALAKTNNMTIFLSIGYSACHWCHVMERESFENEAIAKIMNEHFVCIKVDREEHPEVDRIYMDSVTAMTGSGGWPLNAFLTPDLKPFFGGTYFPPTDRGGRVRSFPQLLTAIGEAWKTKQELIVADADKLSTHVSGMLTMSLPTDGTGLSTGLLATAGAGLAPQFDPEWGGFSGGIKFPPHGPLELLLRRHRHARDDASRTMLNVTLSKMASGGIYDQLGGGFSRYSVDSKWLVPHFEKMLYDNAQLTHVYLEAYQLLGKPLYRKIARESLDYVLRDMTDAKGGFYAAEDADSEGHEGKFYVWSPDEIIATLGEKDAALFNDYFNVTPQGNFEGRTILNRPVPHGEYATAHRMDPAKLQSRLDAMRNKLMHVRDRRIRPGLDDKVLASWNGLMISSFVLGYQVLDDSRYYDAALEAARFMAMTMMNEKGDLLHTYRLGKATLPAYQNDYAALILAFLDIYEMTFDPAWIDRADLLAKTMIDRFWDEEADTFYFTSSEHKNLLARSRSISDTQLPAGNALAALALLRLAKFVDSNTYFEHGEKILIANKSGMERGGKWMGHMLVAADFYLDAPKEIAIAGPAGDPATRALLKVVHQNFLPNKIVAAVDPGKQNAESVGKRVPLLKDKPLQKGKPAAYVCENFSCKQPVSTPADLAKQLGVKPGKSESR